MPHAPLVVDSVEGCVEELIRRVGPTIGIAALRGRSDSEVIKALLNIADSRFQPELLRQAQRAVKLGAGYRIPEPFRDNTPERLERLLRPRGWRQRLTRRLLVLELLRSGEIEA